MHCRVYWTNWRRFVAVDMATLKSTTIGDPESKLAVKRSWLKEVHRLLEEGAQAKRELAALRAQVAAHNDMVRTSKDPGVWKDYDDGMGKIDEGMDKIFGDGGMFGKMFGKGKRHD